MVDRATSQFEGPASWEREGLRRVEENEDGAPSCVHRLPKGEDRELGAGGASEGVARGMMGAHRVRAGSRARVLVRGVLPEVFPLSPPSLAMSSGHNCAGSPTLGEFLALVQPRDVLSLSMEFPPEVQHPLQNKFILEQWNEGLKPHLLT